MTQGAFCTSFAGLVLGLVISALGCAAWQTEPPPDPVMATMANVEEGEPGGVFVGTVEVSARVASIDHDARTATLLLPDGEKIPVEVGPEAVNFDQVAKGDVVTITVTEELVIGVADADLPVEDAVAAARTIPQVGAQPGAGMAGAIRVVATVTEIDREARTATLEFADGSTQLVDVRPDVDLEKRSVGEKVVFQRSAEITIDVWKD